jgi:hypothetical protein
MNYITNTIEVEHEGCTVEVDYSWRKGHSGDWLQPPDEDTIEINKIKVISLINEDSQEVAFNKKYIPNIPDEIIKEGIQIDVEQLL